MDKNKVYEIKGKKKKKARCLLPACLPPDSQGLFLRKRKER